MTVSYIISGLRDIEKLLRPLVKADIEYQKACDTLDAACIYIEAADEELELQSLVKENQKADDNSIEAALGKLIETKVKEAIDWHESKYHDRGRWDDD